METTNYDQILSIIKCLNCGKIFDNPKLLPCGNSICLKCLQNINFCVEKCKFCSEKHIIDANHLKVNQELLKLMQQYKSQSPAVATVALKTASTITTSSNGGSGSYQYDNMQQQYEPKQQLLHDDNESSLPIITGSNRAEMCAKLEPYMTNLKEKIDLINNGYDSSRDKIESEFEKISDEITQAADLLIAEINRKKATMLRDIESYKNEMLLDYTERFSQNRQFETFKNDMNTVFTGINRDFARLNPHTCDVQRLRNLLQRMEKLNACINDHQKLLPETDPKIGLAFIRNQHPFIDVPFIGDITYESIYKIDVKSKIDYFNNNYQQRVFDFSRLIGDDPLTKNIGIISKNKFLILHEKIIGKVKLTFAKIVYYDSSILHELEIKDVGNFVTYLIYDKYILLAFKNSRKNYILQMYDLSLTMLKDVEVNYEISYLLMNDDRIFVIAESKPQINEYDLELKYRLSFGQMSNEKKPFYVKEEIIAINAEKIFVKYDSVLRLVCRNTGLILNTIEKIDNLKQSTIFLDYQKEKYIVFNGYDKVTYYNHKGEQITHNKLRNVNKKFHEFQFSRSGHFAFINYDECTILVI